MTKVCALACVFVLYLFVAGSHSVAGEEERLTIGSLFGGQPVGVKIEGVFFSEKEERGIVEKRIQIRDKDTIVKLIDVLQRVAVKELDEDKSAEYLDPSIKVSTLIQIVITADYSDGTTQILRVWGANVVIVGRKVYLADEDASDVLFSFVQKNERKAQP